VSWLEASVKMCEDSKMPIWLHMGEYRVSTLWDNIHICLGKWVLGELFD